MVEMLVSLCLVATYNPRTPAVKLDVAYYLLLLLLRIISVM